MLLLPVCLNSMNIICKKCLESQITKANHLLEFKFRGILFHLNANDSIIKKSFFMNWTFETLHIVFKCQLNLWLKFLGILLASNDHANFLHLAISFYNYFTGWCTQTLIQLFYDLKCSQIDVFESPFSNTQIVDCCIDFDF